MEVLKSEDCELRKLVFKDSGPPRDYISLDRANRLIKEKLQPFRYSTYQGTMGYFIPDDFFEQDSAEKILREIIQLQEWCKGPTEHFIDPSDCWALGKLCKRARALIGKGEG